MIDVKRIRTSTEINLMNIGPVHDVIAMQVFKMEESIMMQVLKQATGRDFILGDEKRLKRVYPNTPHLNKIEYAVLLDEIKVGIVTITAFPEVTITFDPDHKYL